MNSNEKTRVSEGGLDETITHKLLGYIAGEFGFDNIVVPLTDASLTVVNGAQYLSKHSKKLSKPVDIKHGPPGFHIEGLDQALKMQDSGRNSDLKIIQSQKFELGLVKAMLFFYFKVFKMIFKYHLRLKF